MPYKAVGKVVYVERESGWVVKKRHSSAEKAKQHASALNINVHHPELAKDKKK